MDKAIQFLYHVQSVVIAKAFHFSYWFVGREARATRYLLDKYRIVRRKLPGGLDPATGKSTRFGAFDAYLTTQEGTLGSHVPHPLITPDDLLILPDFRELKSRKLKDGTGTLKTDNCLYHFRDGLAHRNEDDGAAVISDKGQYYYFNGRLHRERGPAIIYKNGSSKFFRGGVEIPFDQFFQTATPENKKSLVWYIGLKDGR